MLQLLQALEQRIPGVMYRRSHAMIGTWVVVIAMRDGRAGGTLDPHARCPKLDNILPDIAVVRPYSSIRASAGLAETADFRQPAVDPLPVVRVDLPVLSDELDFPVGKRSCVTRA